MLTIKTFLFSFIEARVTSTELQTTTEETKMPPDRPLSFLLLPRYVTGDVTNKHPSRHSTETAGAHATHDSTLRSDFDAT